MKTGLCTAAVLMVSLAVSTSAHGQDACPAPAVARATPGGALPQTARKARARQPITVLAIGSSTTAGVGGGGAGFAHRIGPLLSARLGGVPVSVVVSGVLGETAIGALSRLDQEVASRRPDLVLWQLGTNDANFGVTAEAFRAAVERGIAAVRARGADIALIDPQFSRWAEGSAATATKARIVAQVGAARGVPVIRRFAAMEALARADRPLFDRLISWDGLHLTPSGHACLALQTAGTLSTGLR